MNSWKTTLTGILVILSALVPAALEYLRSGAPPNLAVLVPAILSGIGLIKAKDANVSNAQHPVAVARVVPPLLCLLLVPALLLSGCATEPTGNVATDRRNRVVNALLATAAKTLGSVAVNTLQNVVSSHMTGAKIDLAHAAAAGAWASASTILDSGDIARVIDAWSGDRLPAVSRAAAVQFSRAVDSGVPPVAAANAIAATISAASLSAPGAK